MVRRTTTAPAWDDAAGRAALASYVERVGAGNAPAMTRRLYASLVTGELPAALGDRPAAVGVPTTLVVGEDETISRPEMYWSRLFPGEARLVVVAGAGHWLPEERPGAVVDAIEAPVPAGAPTAR
jgi:pimeloyl-ACP methyl ester carboxylesterase